MVHGCTRSSRRLGQFRQQVLDVEDADDVVAGLAVDGNPRVPGENRQLDRLVPGDGRRDREHVGPRRHDLRDVDVAELDHPLDHLPRLLLQQPFAVAFADDRANLLLERVLVGVDLRAAGEAMEHGVDEAGSQGQRRQEHGQRPPRRPGVVEKRSGPKAGNRPGEPDFAGEQKDRRAGDACREQRAVRRPSVENPQPRRPHEDHGRQRLEGFRGQADLVGRLRICPKRSGLLRRWQISFSSCGENWAMARPPTAARQVAASPAKAAQNGIVAFTRFSYLSQITFPYPCGNGLDADYTAKGWRMKAEG